MPSARLFLVFALSIPTTGCGGSTSGRTADASSTPTSPQATPAKDSPAPAAAPSADSPADPSAPAPRPPGPPSGHGADELHRLEGLPEATVRAEFGDPTRARTFVMADCCHEFEIELYNTYPPGKGHDAVQIQEWTWTYDGYSLTVWFHDAGKGWEVLETSRYSDDVEF